jgi:hypothetical protein
MSTVKALNLWLAPEDGCDVHSNTALVHAQQSHNPPSAVRAQVLLARSPSSLCMRVPFAPDPHYPLLLLLF